MYTIEFIKTFWRIASYLVVFMIFAVMSLIFSKAYPENQWADLVYIVTSVMAGYFIGFIATAEKLMTELKGSKLSELDWDFAYKLFMK